MAATHNGTCQICLNSQAIRDGKLVVHGYRVIWNSFRGVCQGADYPPLQNSTTLNARVAAQLSLRGRDLRATTLADITTVTYKHRLNRYKTDTFVAHSQQELDDYCRTRALHPPRFDKERELQVKARHREGQRMLDHAEAMRKAAIEIFGTDLIPRGNPDKIRENFAGYAAAEARKKELEEKGYTGRIYNRRTEIVLIATRA